MIDHHAVLLIGSSLSETGYFSNQDLVTTELVFFTQDSLPIGIARDIVATAYSKPFAKPTKTIVIEAKTISSDAQQTLLKILEEPPVTPKFVIVLPTHEGLLPTIISRLEQPQIQSPVKKPHNELFTIFLNSSYAARLELIAKMTKDKDLERIEFIREGVQSMLQEKKPGVNVKILADCISELKKSGASKKMLLEEIALTIPVS